MAITDVYDRVRLKLARDSGYDVAVSKAIMRQIAQTKSSGRVVPSYFIYYDAHYSQSKNFNDDLAHELFYSQGLRVLPFYNWATDSDQPKYFAEPDDFFHPGDLLTNQIAEQFVTKFGSEIKGLSAQAESGF